MCNVRTEDKICIEELRTRFNLNKMRLYLQDRRLQWFFVIWEELKRIIGVVNVEPSRLVVVSHRATLENVD